jgi:uncharacterized membrane protein
MKRICVIVLLLCAVAVRAQDAWLSLPHTPPRVLAVRGLWHELFGVERALARLGGALQTDCWHHPSSVRFFPDTDEELMTYHLVVVDNINAGALGAARMARLKAYVQHGGSVLFLGGYYGYQGYHGTPLEELAPVTFPEKVTLAQAPTGLVLQAGPNALPGTAVEGAPRVYWYHPVTPKAGAQVVLAADGKPLLVAGAFGTGRVAVFAGSVMGDPPAGQTAFWTWNGWTGVLASTLRRLLEPRAGAGSAEAYRTAVTAALGKARGKRDAEKAVLLKYARLCGDRTAARLLFETATAGADDISWDEVGAIDAGVAPYLDAAFVPLAERLIGSEQTHKASLGLRVLGGTKSKAASATLAEVLETGEIGEGEEALDEPGSATQDPGYRAFALRVGALEGIGRLGDPALLPAVRAFRDEAAKSASKLGSLPTMLTQEDELYQEAVIASLRCGDAAAAGAAIDALLMNRYLFIQMTAVLDEKMQEPNERQILMKKRVAGEIPHQVLRMGQLPLRVVGVPDTVLIALAKRIAAEKDPKIITLAMIIFGANCNPGRTWPAGVGEALRTSPHAAVAELGAAMK